MDKTKEIKKLHELLKEHNIPHEFINVEYLGGYELKYPKSNEFICSVVCFRGTYGYYKGLLEIMGLLTKEEECYDDVLGFLTAEDVFNRISSHYNKAKEKQNEV